MAQGSEYAVADFPTIQSGYVVRWYVSAEHRREIASASRDGVHATVVIEPGLAEEAAKVSRLIRDWYDKGGRGEKPWAAWLTHSAHFTRDELTPLAEVSR